MISSLNSPQRSNGPMGWYLLTVQTKRAAKLRNPKSGKPRCRWVPHSNSSREIRMAWRLDENHGEETFPSLPMTDPWDQLTNGIFYLR